jgi:tetratricopeptide (TPR) repeat protein
MKLKNLTHLIGTGKDAALSKEDMDKTAANKLVIVSKNGREKALSLLEGSTTIGSAPDNDIRLEEPGVSGFHAELRTTDDQKVLLVDFNSETGTFLNKEKIDKESVVKNGDTIQIGSTRAVFFPRNAVIVREEIDPRKPCGKPSVLTPRVKKTLVFVSFFLVSMSILKINSENIADSKAPRRVAAAIMKEDEISTTVAEPDPAPEQEEEKEPEVETQVAPMVSEEMDRKVQDNNADIYFKVAAEFSQKWIWDSALEYYEKVFEIDPAYPGLSEQLARMKNEIDNKNSYEEGMAAIDDRRYEEGLNHLQAIGRRSVYFEKSLEHIAVAREKADQGKRKHRKINLNTVAQRRIENALTLYKVGKIEASLDELKVVFTKLKKTEKVVTARANMISKQIALSKSLYDKGDKAYAEKQFAEAFAIWEKCFAVDKRLIPDRKSYLARTINRKKVDEYNARAHAAYAAGDFVNAAMYNRLAFSISRDHTQSLKMRKMLDEKAKELYEQGYILEGYNNGKAYEKWRQVLKISNSKSDDHYKKAFEKLNAQ